jgi:hypothetical protein
MRNFILLLAAALALLPGSPSSCAAAEDCKLLLQNNHGNIPEVDGAAINRSVQVLWYPHSSIRVFTHMELIVGDELWVANKRYKKFGKALAPAKAAIRTKKTLVSFHLNVSDEEFENLKSWLEKRNGSKSHHTCSSGTCHAIAMNTKIRVPFPISSNPTLAAAYLSAMKLLGKGRITRIEFIGNSKLSGIASFGFFNETILTSVGGALIVGGLDASYHYIQYLIPIIHSLLGFGQNSCHQDEFADRLT